MKSKFTKGLVALLMGLIMFLMPATTNADQSGTSWEQEATFSAIACAVWRDW